jgi:hemerythrin-like domain-containing protein
MEELMNKLVEKTGIDRSTAQKVIDFLHEHKDDVLHALEKSTLKDKLPGGLGDKLGSLF